MSKRPRPASPQPTWWHGLKSEIEVNGGFLNPDVFFDETCRRLSVNESIPTPGILLMKIPKNSIIAKEFAKKQFPWLNQVESELRGESQLHSALGDVLISLALGNDSRETNLYLQTLPEADSFNTLPRKWSKEEIRLRLHGSPVMKRVEETKEGVRRDFEIVQKLWSIDNTTKEFPVSFERYSLMLAVVSSRAFAIGSNDDEAALVPVLDLCDHCRGQNEKKNLTYAVGQDGAMLVKAYRPIARGETLRLTYGAQANANLLLNYGFTIPRNIEPDGSSNDTLDFQVGSAKSVVLRAGPKSYSYGCLIKALELFQAPSSNMMVSEDHEGRKECVDDDNLEDFLDFCDNEEQEGEDEEFDIYGTMDGIEEDESNNSKQELAALSLFKKTIGEKLSSYLPSPSEDKSDLQGTDRPGDRFAAILLQSEKRTLHFFARAIDKIIGLMEGQSHIVQIDNECSDCDDAMVESQTTELAEAFMKIRHSF